MADAVLDGAGQVRAHASARRDGPRRGAGGTPTTAGREALHRREARVLPSATIRGRAARIRDGEHGHGEPQADARHATVCSSCRASCHGCTRSGERALTVAHVLPWPGIGGTEHATLRIARAATERGYRSIAFYRDDSPVVGEFFRDADAGDGAVRAGRAQSAASAAVRAEQPRVAPVPSERTTWTSCTAPTSMPRSRSPRPAGSPACPCCVTSGIPWPTMLRREALVLSAVDTFVFVSQDTWSTFAYRVGPSRGRVLYDGLGSCSRRAGADRVREVRRELGRSRMASR